MTDTTFAFHPRTYGSMNWLGVQTLLWREVARFFKVSVQTILAPTVTTLLYVLVFHTAFGKVTGQTDGVPYIAFLAPGLAMMSILNNAFANSSSSLTIAKVQGNSVDFLMPPLTPWELTIGFVGGATVRGVLCGLASLLAAAPFADITPVHWWAALYFPIMASICLGALGLIGGIWAEKFDHLAAVTNFIITPLSFLSGTFYATSVLPEPWRTISHANPFFCMIDGFRYGVTGYHDQPILPSVLVVAGVTFALLLIGRQMLASGYKLRA